MRAAPFAVVLIVSSACGDDGASTPPEPPDAQERTFELRIENVAPWTMLKSGTVDTGTSGMPGPLGPGQSFEISFTAGQGQAISFATMFGESNDWFFAPAESGIALHDPRTGEPVSGDVTDQVGLWNAGTEIDQEPAVGDATAPRQPRPDFGAADPDATVREVPVDVTLTDGTPFTRPAVADMIGVELRPGDDRSFTLVVTNRSTDQTLVTSQGAMAVHLSPLAWSLHQAPAPLFTKGVPDRGQGLARIAEDGMPADLGASLAARSGFATPLSPGVFVVHREGAPLFMPGEADYGQGLESIAEDGDPAPLRDKLAGSFVASGAFDTPTGAAMPGPAMPGAAYVVQVTGAPGDALSFATMFGMSNDWFFATPPDGIALFDGDAPVTGDVSDRIGIYDAGTEVDQEPAIGPDTAPQQPAPDTGALDPDRTVRPAAYGVAPTAHVRVTLELR